MAQGKLKSFIPLLVNGVHSTYSGQNGLLYKFTVTIDQQGTMITGTCNSSKQQPSWKIEAEYTYEVAVNGQYTNINKLKSIDQVGGFGGGGSKGPSPEFGIQKAFECAVECTLKFFELNQEIYSQAAEDSVLNKMWSYMLEGSESRRWINMSAMRLSLLKMTANGHNFRIPADMKLSDWLFSNSKLIADNMEKTVKHQVEVDKNNKAAQPPQ